MFATSKNDYTKVFKILIISVEKYDDRRLKNEHEWNQDF